MNQPGDLWHADELWQLGCFPGSFLADPSLHHLDLPIALEFGDPKSGYTHIMQKRRRPIDVIAKRWYVDLSYSIPWLVWFKCNQLLKVYHQGGGRFQLVGFDSPGCEIILSLHKSRTFMKVVTAIPGSRPAEGEYLGTIGSSGSPKKPWPIFACKCIEGAEATNSSPDNEITPRSPVVIIKKRRRQVVSEEGNHDGS
jgi:hypothetical protein